jgi:hypothetical protein
MPISYNLRVGTPDTTPDAPSHVLGVRQGNSPPSLDPGFIEVGGGRLKVTARRSTSINPENRNPITPGAPVLPPP